MRPGREEAWPGGKSNFIFADSAFFRLENLASIEIKDIEDYTIARELITMYFAKEVGYGHRH